MAFKKMRIRVSASYTVEAAGVMAVVFFAMMVVFGQAFHLRAEAVGKFALHQRIERERHEQENRDKSKITLQDGGMQWDLEITAPVYRPEESLRRWSLLEGMVP